MQSLHLWKKAGWDIRSNFKQRKTDFFYPLVYSDYCLCLCYIHVSCVLKKAVRCIG